MVPRVDIRGRDRVRDSMGLWFRGVIQGQRGRSSLRLDPK